jgi:acetyltransferase-like isoleucine patch superfamily enzyme
MPRLVVYAIMKARRAGSRFWIAGMNGLVRFFLTLHGCKVGNGLQARSLPLCKRHPGATIEIGNAVTILNKLSENPAGICHRTALIAANAESHLTIGNGVGISGAVIYCSNQITIGDYVNIGAGARIYDTDFHPLDAAARRSHDGSRIRTAPVRIGDDVWICAGATVLKGVTIGARFIVACGAVVAHDVPEDVIVAGIPARVIRSLPSAVGRIGPTGEKQSVGG